MNANDDECVRQRHVYQNWQHDEDGGINTVMVLAETPYLCVVFISQIASSCHKNKPSTLKSHPVCLLLRIYKGNALSFLVVDLVTHSALVVDLVTVELPICPLILLNYLHLQEEEPRSQQ